MPLFYRQVSSTKRKPTLQKSRFLASVSVRLLTLLAIHKNPFNFFSKYSFKLYFLANGRARKYHRNFVHQIQLELFFATARFKFNSFENSTFIKHSNWIICEWRTKISTEDLLLPKHVFYSQRRACMQVSFDFEEEKEWVASYKLTYVTDTLT